ncbi:SNF2-related protein [Roseateles toxinivorans]|uniref:Helicase-like protein n=1 Tax=Roseateles toxinivorans TaxID=270368 RepID=A0A4R6QTY7_9BURK|nr:SNF2-related protein [Roseateles toxinivorans]TDP74726.1 helicase-like protein [Roseateles toxinivorans]
MDARTWRFLRAENAAAYIKEYEKQRKDGWKLLELATTQRQFRTARDILNRLKNGIRGVLLADDVGLGKTTVATLCALVVAGKQGSVRILAPNEMMARRWRQEIEIHVNALTAFAERLDLQAVRSNRGANVSKLKPGQIAVSTHTKATDLRCNLLIVDEAHRTRSDQSRLATSIKEQRDDIDHIVVLTATPFSIDSRDLARLLARVGADEDVIKSMAVFAKNLEDLWKGKAIGDPALIADQLASSAGAAVEAMKPYVIRHGIGNLTKSEKAKFGEFETESPRSDIGDTMLEAMLRTDRALLLGLRTRAWTGKRRNDPRYHVARGKLLADLGDLAKRLEHKTDAPDARHAAEHVRTAIACLQDVPVHPKVESTAALAQGIVDANEKVLVFCDHHVPAGELAGELSKRMQRTPVARSPDKKIWLQAWEAVLGEKEGSDLKPDDRLRRRNFVNWLCSDGVRAQVGGWLRQSLRRGMHSDNLASLLRTPGFYVEPKRASIADQAWALYKQLIDEQSASTRTQLLRGSLALPGATLSRACAVCEVPEGTDDQSIYFQNQPDTVLAIFNSPFGPDVLVTTDKLSEGVDLHRFCRHLIHHELDPSPVRTVQRNGRLRRVGSWAARTHRPIVISYPALRGTRDERVVEIMQMRLKQFDLLLGGVGQDIDPDESTASERHALKILALAQEKMKGLKLCSL